MTLSGSKTEQDLRVSLAKTRDALFKTAGGQTLLGRLKLLVPTMRTAYLLDWVPDQDQEWHQFLVDDQWVVDLTIQRVDTGSAQQVVSEVIPLHTYAKKKRKRRQQVLLAVALELARAELQINR